MVIEGNEQRRISQCGRQVRFIKREKEKGKGKREREKGKGKGQYS